MLPKKIRLTTALFDQVFKSGRVCHSERFWMRSLLLPAGTASRFAVAVPKKVAPTAVLRNKNRRIVYLAIEDQKDILLQSDPGHMVIFGVKKDISKIPFGEVAKEIAALQLKKGQK
jgi:ribonuclease P protein component